MFVIRLIRRGNHRVTFSKTIRFETNWARTSHRGTIVPRRSAINLELPISYTRNNYPPFLHVKIDIPPSRRISINYHTMPRTVPVLPTPTLEQPPGTRSLIRTVLRRKRSRDSAFIPSRIPFDLVHRTEPNNPAPETPVGPLCSSGPGKGRGARKEAEIFHRPAYVNLTADVSGCDSLSNGQRH